MDDKPMLKTRSVAIRATITDGRTTIRIVVTAHWRYSKVFFLCTNDKRATQKERKRTDMSKGVSYASCSCCTTIVRYPAKHASFIRHLFIE